MSYDDEEWEQRYKELQAKMTRDSEEVKWARGIREKFNADPGYQAAIRAYESGTTTVSPKPQFSSEEPEYVKVLRSELTALRGDVGSVKSWKDRTERERTMAGVEEVNRMEAELQKNKPYLPKDFFGGDGKINQLMANGLSFEDASEFLEHKHQREQSSQPNKTSFGPVGGSPPPTDTGKEAANWEESTANSEAKFMAALQQRG